MTMNEERHADCYQGYQEYPIASVPGYTEERDICALVGAEHPEKGPCNDPVSLHASLC